METEFDVDVDIEFGDDNNVEEKQVRYILRIL
jgi:hypothetical protein